MRWTTLLPADLAAFEPAAEPRSTARYDVPLPRDPAGLSLDQLVLSLRLQAGDPLAGDTAEIVRGWPPSLRRRIALRLLADVAGDPAAGPDYMLVFAFERLVDDAITWSRADLAWALRQADRCPETDGGSQILPALIAGTFDAAALSGFGPALQAVFDSVLAETDMNRYAHGLLVRLLGEAIGREAGVLGYHLLNPGDTFGVTARRRLDERRIAGAAVLTYAWTLLRPIPSKAWLRAAAMLPPGEVPAVALGALASTTGKVSDDNDEQARGLVWLLPADATELLAEVAFAAADGKRAARTASAAVEALAVRPGRVAREALARLASTSRDRSLLGRAQLAVSRQAGW